MRSHSKILILLGLIVFYANSSYAIHTEDASAQEEYIDTGEGISNNDNSSTSAYDVFSVTKVASEGDISYCKTAKIIALNKITAKSQELVFKLGEAKYFGNIEIKIHKCLKNHNPYSPYSAILLTVVESKTDEDPMAVFQGWLVSSNASISTLEHPIYEIFAKDCL
jgi:hypothetical protein